MASFSLKDPPILIAIFSAAISVVTAMGSAFYSHHSAEIIQRQQVVTDLLGKFIQGNGQVTLAGGDFMNAVNEKKDLRDFRIKLNGALDQRIDEIMIVQAGLGLKPEDAEFYKKCLVNLIEVTNSVKSAEEMPKWSVAFGRVLDAQRILAKRFNSHVSADFSVAQVVH